jgi:hypothetical protein
MKKIIVTYLAGFMTATMLTCGAAYATSANKSIDVMYSDIKVYIDDVLANLKDAKGDTVEPFIYNGTTYLPVRGIAETMGAQVEWDGATKSVKIYKDVLPGTAYLLDVCPPYQTSEYSEFTPSNGKSFTMGGTKYTNGFTLGSYGYAWFNLNGKYSSISLDLGHIDGSGDVNKTISFYVDGKLVKEYEVEYSELPQRVTVPLNYGLQLKIERSGGSSGTGKATPGLGNVTIK